jgi:tRNA pseudouridine32 synthase/23S rRNA pseudouridine746 synthase
MNNPFCYEPHPLCIEAADEVRRYLSQQPEWADEVAAGKMFGVLVCEDGNGTLGFLAAYSGQILGRADWPWFVPAVFDYLQPDGYFRQEEARISYINNKVKTQETSSERIRLTTALNEARQQSQQAIDDYRQVMQQSKTRRDEERASGICNNEQIRESQFQKAELRRLKHYWNERIAAIDGCLQPLEAEIAALKQERKQRSDALQRWLFDHFLMLNDRGEQRSLTSIFASHGSSRFTSHGSSQLATQGVPPSGSGECCAPKLLQYAYAHHLRPLSIAEFWQGRSPRMEVRHHNQYYTACRGKCKPILEWMLSESFDGTNWDELEQSGTSSVAPSPTPSQFVPLRPTIIHSTPSFIVINKPAGLLSVPGLTGQPSVESILKAQYPEVYMVHRLDMDTSGLMVVALTKAAYHHLQRQFLERTVHKEYVAVLEHDISGSGTIALPLRPDLLDRPRQVVDPDHGKPALTEYIALGDRRVRLIPHTGRTHQLRVHCAHAQGLNNPILGDTLYGSQPADRLYLHAEVLAFDDPDTGERQFFRQFSLPIHK